MRALIGVSLALALVLLEATTAAAAQYDVKGMVVGVDRGRKIFTASIEEIPNFMRAMTMPFEVRNTAELDGIAPGAIVEFVLIVDRTTSYAEKLRVVRYQAVESDPSTASRLKLLREIVGGGAASQALEPGERVPEFTLTDQKRRPFRLSDARGKVVAINFVYTSCALPNFCLRLANNFNVLQRRFKQRLGRDLVLLTVTFDPVHDTPDVLAQYSAQWNANPASWKFLTGAVPDVQRVCQLFGVHAFANEGLLDHTLHTVFIDRRGMLAANIEGNQFTAAQLGDLTEKLLNREIKN
jgi:protein SCO1